jgi:predicted DNA-binding transcriptional regulator AlpA
MEPENPFLNFDESLKRYLADIIQREIEKNFLRLVPISEEQDIVFINDASRITGLARQTIYQLVGTNEIPYLPKGGRKKLAFSRKALLAWMEGRK